MMKLTFISIKLLKHSLPINSLSATNNLSYKSIIMSALRIKLTLSLSESTPLCSYTLKYTGMAIPVTWAANTKTCSSKEPIFYRTGDPVCTVQKKYLLL